MTSHLNEEEVAALLRSKLPTDTPFLIRGVSSGHLSIARYYGGCTFQGREYVYVPPTDELVRRDVVGWLGKHRRKQRLRQPSPQLVGFERGED